MDFLNRPPAISIVTQTVSGVAEVTENCPLDTPTAYVYISHPDPGSDRQTACNLSSSPDGVFRLNPITHTSFTVVTAATIDRESRDSYEVTINCRENPQSSSSERNFSILVLDENDNRPRFERDLYEISSEENQGIGAFLLTVKATDPDSGNNGKISYSLLNSTEFLAIDNASGVVATTINLRYGRPLNVIEATVEAIDGGETTQKSSSAMIRITLLNVNDFPPVFNSTHFHFTLLRNQAKGSAVGRVFASDGDHAPYDIFTYSLSEDEDIFTVDAITGELFTAKILSTFSASVYRLRVFARDNWPPFFKAMAEVTIDIINASHQAPIFLFPNATHYTVEVSSDAEFGFNMTNVIAYSHNPSLRLTYEFIEHTDIVSHFSINRIDGAIAVNDSLNDRQLKTVIQLGISVTDDAFPSLVTTSVLLVKVNYEKKYFNEAVIAVTSSSLLIISALVLLIICVAKKWKVSNRLKIFSKENLTRSLKWPAAGEGEGADHLGNAKVQTGIKEINCAPSSVGSLPALGFHRKEIGRKPTDASFNANEKNPGGKDGKPQVNRTLFHFRSLFSGEMSLSLRFKFVYLAGAIEALDYRSVKYMMSSLFNSLL